nr:hypothetical protein [Cellulosimicrobium sp. MM]
MVLGARAARDAARLLAGRCRATPVRLRVVALGVPFPRPRGADETSELVDGDPDDTTSDDYARAKRGAEIAVTDALGDRAILLRAGLILGPRENVGRLPWWLRRVARGGRCSPPGPPTCRCST